MARLIKVAEAQELGRYVDTAIDDKKTASDFRLIAKDGKYYSVAFNDGRQNITIVGKRQFDKFAKGKSYVTDF